MEYLGAYFGIGVFLLFVVLPYLIYRKFKVAIKGLDEEIHSAMQNKNNKLADFYVAVIDEVAENIMNSQI